MRIPLFQRLGRMRHFNLAATVKGNGQRSRTWRYQATGLRGLQRLPYPRRCRSLPAPAQHLWVCVTTMAAVHLGLQPHA